VSDTGAGASGQEQEQGRTPRLPAVAYPLLAVLFAGILVWSFSRILLASGKDQAVAIAILMALNILVGSALVAYGRRVRGRPLFFPIIVLAAIALIGAGGVVSVVWGDRAPAKGETPGPKEETVTLTAQGLKFIETKLTFTAGSKIALTFENKDAGVPHNFVLFDGPDANARPLFRGDVVTGPIVTTYRFTAPTKPGDYFFHCEIHTTMTGTATVVAGGQTGGPSPGGGGGPGAKIELHAKNLAFSPTALTATSSTVTIHFVNDDPNIPHNVAVFNGADANAPPIVHGDLVTGPGSADITFTLPGPGTYFFHCDVHPAQMTGTITFAG
jgi:plastocyanin